MSRRCRPPQLRVYSYDIENRLTKGTSNGVTVLECWYDGIGRRLGGVSVTSGAAQVYGVQYGYDGAGRLAAVTNGSVNIAYAYNSTNGMIEAITSSVGGTNILVLGKVYDAYRRLLSSTATTTSQVDAYAYSYDQAGTRTDMTTGSGLLWSYAYDDLGQLTNAVATLSAQPVPGRAYAYAYDTIGNRTSAAQNEEAFGYAANLLNQYTNVTSPGVAQVLGVAATNATVTADFVPAERLAEHYLLKIPFDNSSGLVYDTVTVTGVVNNVNVSNEDAVASASVDLLVPASARTLSYDLDGNMTEDGLRKYTWNGENRLVKVVPTAALAAALPANLVSTNTYRYDSEGRMTERSVCSGTGTNVTRFVYDGWLLLAELDGSNDVIRSYVWGADLSGSFQGAGGVGGLLAVVDHTDGVVEYFPVYDGNGNVMALIDSRDRTMAAQYEYDPFGKIIRQTGDFADDNPFRFSTKYHDQETGLLYYGYRYLCTDTGRWVSRDPIEELGGENLNVFVQNSPVNMIDSLGLRGNDPPPAPIPPDALDAHYIEHWSKQEAKVIHLPPPLGTMTIDGETSYGFPEIDMEINAGTDRCTAGKGCYHLSFESAEMHVHAWYSGWRSRRHERLHVDDGKNLIFLPSVTYALGKAGCYTRDQANCWQSVATQVAPAKFRVCGELQSYILRDRPGRHGETRLNLEYQCRELTQLLSRAEGICRGL